ncbi:MAG: hypothetical protein IKD74_02780 [Clostridia bacterium]|nr:hypothetical protein [Clostridia bacterium]
MKLKNILEANICAFGQTIFDMHSLEDDEFCRALDFYLNANDLDEILEEYAYEFDFDMDDIQNKCKNSSCKNRGWDYMDIMNCCRSAFLKTITEDRTIDVEAFIDNIVNELKNK